MTPKQTLFECKAKALSSKNSEGKFDILAFHANFITIVEKEPIVVLTDKNEKVEFKFATAIISNNSNTVLVFAEPTTV